MLAGPLLGLSLAGGAAAEDVEAAERQRASGFVLELRALGGGAALAVNRDNDSVHAVDIVEFAAGAVGLDVRAGFDLGEHVALGWTGTVTRYWRTGALQVRHEETFNDYFFQFDDSPNLWAPLGVYVELHPARDFGAFIGLSGSLGYLPPVARPRPGSLDPEMYMAGYAIEAGYDSSRARPHAFGVFLRYSAWSGSESVLQTDYPEGISVGQLSLGVRWAFRP